MVLMEVTGFPLVGKIQTERGALDAVLIGKHIVQLGNGLDEYGDQDKMHLANRLKPGVKYRITISEA